MRRLDGAEICHPLIYTRIRTQRDLERFSARAPVAAIGSSDFHGLGPMGLCRTYVFVHERSEQGILDAVRSHRTVVYGRDGQAYGDPVLVKLAEEDGRLRSAAQPISRAGWLDWLSRASGLFGLAGFLAFSRRPLRR
jgi:hypothetical protein